MPSTAKRIPVALDPNLERRLGAYATAAAAAGIGLLCTANTAEAEIVYTETNQKIVFGGWTYLPLDLNHDGQPDFNLSAYGYGYSAHGNDFATNNLYVSGAKQSNAVLTNAKGYAGPARAGHRIGPLGAFSSAGRRGMAGCFFHYFYWSHFYSRTSWGPWQNVTDRYLGLRFMIKGQPHYGWARLTVLPAKACQVTATLTGYAYETVPNKPIIAGLTQDADQPGKSLARPDPVSLRAPESRPEPGTLGFLALGLPGLPIRRTRLFNFPLGLDPSL
jgi:hypothetical protein